MDLRGKLCHPGGILVLTNNDFTPTPALSALWRASKGVVDEAALGEPVRSEGRETGTPGGWHDCPCGGGDHLAWRPLDVSPPDGGPQRLAGVLTCFATGRQWLVRPHDAAGVVRREEEAYLRLLARAGRVVRRVVAERGWSDETAAYLWETHGVPRDVADGFVEG